MRAEVGKILTKQTFLEGEITDLTNAMGDTQRALGRIETHAAHLLIATARMESGVADLLAILPRIETHTTHLLAAAERAESGAADLSATLPRIETHTAHLLVASADAATERSALLKQLSSTIDRLSVRDETIRLALDAVRVDQQRVAEGAKFAIDAASADQRQIGEAVQEQLRAVETASALVHEKVLDLLNMSNQGFGLAGVQISRLDTLVQRAALPLGPDVLMQMPDGILLVPADDAALLAAVWETEGCPAKGTVAVATALVEDGDQIIDVGANVGLLTIPLARRVGASGCVIAVEPSYRIADLLRRSAFLNFGPGRVEVHHCTAGASAGTATLNIGPIAGHPSLLPLPSLGGVEQVEVRTLDDIVPPGTHLKLLKIDIQGFGPEIWRGMTRILLESPELAIILESKTKSIRRANTGVGAWLEVFCSSGFSAYEIDEETGTVARFRVHEELSEVVSVNFLLLRQPVLNYSRLKNQ